MTVRSTREHQNNDSFAKRMVVSGRERLFTTAVKVVVLFSVSIVAVILLINTLPTRFDVYGNPYLDQRLKRSAVRYDEWKNSSGSWCFTNDSIVTNESWFRCPRPGQNSDMTSCCELMGKQECCKPKKIEKDDSQKKTEVDVITVVSSVTACVVSITCCMILYCCCCQRRPEIGDGRVGWVTRAKKNKLNTDGNEADAQAETILMDYEEYAKQHHMTHLYDHEDYAKKTKSTEHLHAEEDNTSHSQSKQDTSSIQHMTVPIINIQASTPEEKLNQFQ